MKNIDYALMLIKAGKLEGARDILEELIKNDPRDRDILYNLGMCCSEMGDAEKAVQTLSECVKVSPPGGHPKSPTCGHLKIPHPTAAFRT